MTLDTTYTEPMYLLGRLWAVCEAAIKDAGQHLDEAIITTLGARPMTGWARLHGEFIVARRELSMGRQQYYDGAIGAILELVPGTGFPDGPMGMERQAPLYMGYRHQRSVF